MRWKISETMGYSLFLFLKSGEYTQTREPQAVSSVGRDMAIWVCVCVDGVERGIAESKMLSRVLKERV